MKAHMFTNAQNLLIQDPAIHTAGRDITIINYCTCHEPELVLAHSSCVTFWNDWNGLSQSPSKVLYPSSNLISSVIIMRIQCLFGGLTGFSLIILGKGCRRRPRTPP